MADDIEIRELRGLAEICTIYPLYSQSGSLPEAVFAERLAAMLAQGNYRCIAAWQGERMVGVAGFWTGMQLWSGRYMEADHLVVDKELRSRGIGARLMAWIEAEARRLDCDMVRAAMLLGRERTHDFYRRSGYSDDSLLEIKPLSGWADAEFPEAAAHRTATETGR